MWQFGNFFIFENLTITSLDNNNNLNMSLLFDLSNQVLGGFLALWLTVEEIRSLDSACCNRVIRKQYLSSVAATSFILVNESDAQDLYPLRYLTWINQRNVSLWKYNFPCSIGQLDSEVSFTEKNAQRLKHLYLQNCCNLSDRVFGNLTKHCGNLSHLVVGSNDYPGQITNVSLMALGYSSPLLRSLTINQNANITDDGMVTLSKSCGGLREIYLLKCSKLGDCSICSIADNCPLLNVLSISYNLIITRTALANVLIKCSELQEFSLISCSALLPGSSSLPSGTDLSHLRNLNVSSSSAIIDSTLYQFLNRCKHLTSLLLQDNQSITDVGASIIASSLPHLKFLNVDSCYRITQIGIINIISRCQHLQQLYLHACNVSNLVVKTIASTCTLLTHLGVTWCVAITDEAIQLLSQGCRALEELSLNGCERLTDQAIVHLARSCAKLRVLSIPFCHKITDCTVSGFQAKFPAMQIAFRKFERSNLA